MDILDDMGVSKLSAKVFFFLKRGLLLEVRKITELTISRLNALLYVCLSV